jgi:hypothetical protein
MGVVFEVRDPHASRRLALKLIPRREGCERAVTRFLREARALARIRHPNVVPIHDVGEAPEGHYLVMDYIEGTNLGEALVDSPMPPCDAAHLVMQLASAVQAMHVEGLLHRDLKPENVLLRADTGTPILLDFGLVLEGSAERLTATGQMVGTPYAMSPEQVRGDRDAMGPATDVYGLGVILFMLSSGQVPFEGEGVLEIVAAVCRRDAEWPDGLPASLVAVGRRAMAKESGERYPSAKALSDDLERFLAGRAVAAPRRRILSGLALAVCVVLVAASTLVWLGQEGPESSTSPNETPSAARPTLSPSPEAGLARVRGLRAEARLDAARDWLRRFPEHARAPEVRALYRRTGLGTPLRADLPLRDWYGVKADGDRAWLLSAGVHRWGPGDEVEEQARIPGVGFVHASTGGPAGWRVFAASRGQSNLALLSPTGEVTRTRVGTHQITALRSLGDEGLLVGHGDGTISYVAWNDVLGGGASVVPRWTRSEHRSPVWGLVANTERTWLMSSSGRALQERQQGLPDNRVVTWRLTPEGPGAPTSERLPGPGFLAAHPDGRHVALAVGWVYELHLYKIEGGKRRRTFEGTGARAEATGLLAGSKHPAHAGPIRGMQFSPGGLLVTAGGPTAGPAELRVWNPMTGEELETLRRPGEAFRDVSLSADGRWLYATSLPTKGSAYVERFPFAP